MFRRVFGKRWVRWSVVISFILLAMATAFWGLLFLVFTGAGDDLMVDKSSAISCACEWARLAPFPKTAKSITVDVTGNMFTRGFVIRFTAPRADVEKWLRSSPGTKHQKILVSDSGSQTIEIEPGGGAQFSEVVLLDGGTRVRIRTYWS